MSYRTVVALTISLLVFQQALPCGPFFPNSYLVYGGKDVHEMPPAMFWVECLDILGLTETVGAADQESLRPTAEVQPERTVEIDLAEFAEAVQGRPSSSQLIKKYTDLREALKLRTSAAAELRRRQERPGTGPNIEQIDSLIDVSLQDAIEDLPAEFREYIQGAIAYYRGFSEDAVSHFSNVLQLPTDQRTYRSVWAAFMLGRILIEESPEKATEFFELTRELAGKGFRDQLDLAGDSLGWQARIELSTGAYVDSIHDYAAYWQRAVRHSRTAYVSLKWLCARALDDETRSLETLVQDDLSRAIITAWLVSFPSRKKAAARWLEALETFESPGAVARADRLAWAAYEGGNMEEAARWLEHSEPDAPYAQWVRAKLLLRSGRQDEASELLKTLAEEFPTGPSWIVESTDSNLGASVQAKGLVYGDLGYTLASKGDYTGALTAFLKKGEWNDAACLAERVLTLEELETYLNTHAEDPAIKDNVELAHGKPFGEPLLLRLQYLLARRWARLGRWDRALSLYPAHAEDLIWPTWKEKPFSVVQKAHELADHLEKAESLWATRREKARHLFEAGRILRKYGMELIGTELTPDWTVFGGNHFLTVISDPEESGTSLFGPDYAARFRASAVEPNERYHYRHIAAELMWQCAELLPNNDVLGAHALYLGGTYLMLLDPDAADRFYKALVRRNPNLLIAQKADQLRWFPAEFTATVLYYSPERYPSKKKAAAIILVTLALLLVSVWFLRRLNFQKDDRLGRDGH